MSDTIESQIKNARENLDEAFKINDVSRRNELLTIGLKKFDEIEDLDLDENQKEKIKNIKIAHSKQLLRNLKPTPSVDDDIITFMIINKLTKNHSNILESNPKLKKNLSDFKESLHRSHEFRQILRELKNE